LYSNTKRTMKKVLIITYYWPPSGGAGVQRWVKFAKYLRDFGWEPIVYIPENPHYPILDKSFEKDLPENLHVIKHPIWEPYSFYKKFMGMKKEEKVQHGFIQEKKQNSFKQNISVWIRSNFFIPDARKFWIKPSIKYLTGYFKNIEKPDVIISTGPPHSMHLIAMGLKKSLNIPWVADFRDPWTGIDFYDQLKLTTWADRKHKRLERMVLSTADAVISIGWTMAKELEDLGSKKVEVITNGFDEDDFKTNHTVTSKHEFILSHIGSLNKDRNPEILWQSLKELINENEEFRSKLKIRLVGKVDHIVNESIKKYHLEDFIIKIDYLPHDKLGSIFQSSEILLLLLNDTPNIEGIVTGKIFEYLAANRSILCIGSSTGDAAKIINITKSGKAVDFNDKKGISSFLLERFSEFQNGNKLKNNNQNIDTFSRKRLTENLCRILDDVTN